MPLVITNAVQVRLIWARSGVPHAINVIGATGVGPSGVNQAFANTLGTMVKSAFSGSGWAAIIPTTATLDKVGVRSIGLPNQPEYLDANAGVPGTAGNNYLPPQIALVATLRTALAGKEYRGRFYASCIAVTASDTTGNATAAATAGLVDFMTALQGALSGNSLTMAVLSRKLSVATPVSLILSRNSVFETQRRRSEPGV